MLKQIAMLPGAAIVCVGDYPENRALPISATTIEAETDESDGWKISDEELRVYLLTALNVELGVYIYTKYDAGTQESFNSIHQDPDETEEHRAEAKKVWVWVKSVMAYYYARKREILAADTAGLCAIRWDYSRFDATDPQVSLESLIPPEQEA